jgi:phosphoribosylaminoimidazole-succinocarboxamide synthase
MLDEATLRAALPHALLTTDLEGMGERDEGKVRDLYRQSGRRLLVATDRISAFDRVIGTIPFKGQVLNQLSAWWFEHTADLVANHIIAVPDPCVTVAHEAVPLPVEVVVRGYLTGVTSTSLWMLYSQGVSRPYGLDLPPGLEKDARLPAPVITPTTKAAKGEHDERLTSDEVVSRGLVAPALWAEVQAAALALFARGTELAARGGLILVDTKYEFGLVDGRLCVIDEIHTPDSSRYWEASTWPSEVRELDKEYVRKWLKSVGYSGEGPTPPLPDDVRIEAARRYIHAFERLTGETFVPGAQPVRARMDTTLAPWRA